VLPRFEYCISKFFERAYPCALYPSLSILSSAFLTLFLAEKTLGAKMVLINNKKEDDK